MSAGRIRFWLSKQPSIASIRIRTASGDHHLDLPEGGRRWATLEQIVLRAGAIDMTALDERGKVLRVRAIEARDYADAGVDPPGSSSTSSSPSVQSDVPSLSATASPTMTPSSPATSTRRESPREISEMLDVFGRQLNGAYREGAAASNSQSEHLISLVTELTTHLSVAITNLHNMSMNFAQVLAQREEDAPAPRIGSPTDGLVERVLGQALGAVASGSHAQNGKAGK